MGMSPADFVYAQVSLPKAKPSESGDYLESECLAFYGLGRTGSSFTPATDLSRGMCTLRGTPR
jgi:hypothetical protein